MKGSIVAAAAALFGNAAAVHVRNVHGHAHAHDLFQKRDEALCTTYYTTITGAMTWYPTPGVSSNKTVVPTTAANNYTTKAVPTTTSIATTPSTTSTTVQLTTSTSAAPVTVTSIATVVTVPTLVVETCSTTGTYTFPSTTVVVTETTTVCGAQTTSVTSGTNTIGGVTTVVETATTVVCPYATASTQSGGVVTSILATTTYVCPSAGTYTIAPITTVVTTDTVVICPVVATFTPGTYTKPAVTTTVTETDIVVYCPFATSSTSTSTVAAVTTTAVPAVTTTAVAKAATTSAAVKVSTVKASTSTSATTSASTSVATLGGGSQWAITYTPYTTSGECKGASAVLTDIAAIKDKGFTTVRVYSTDCDTLPNVGAACSKYEMKMIIGVFIGEVGCDNDNPDVASQIAAIKSWGLWDLVELVVVGNEAGNDGYCTPAELSSLIVQVKDIVSEAGASCPVTTTDTVNTWQDTEFSSVICAVVDVVACNAHAYFNAETTPAKAGDFVQGQLDIVKEICGLEGYVLETGWPSACVANGVATCSSEDQATAISSLKEVVGGSVVFFSFSDDDWKEDGTCGCEQHWGCGQLF